LKKLASEAAIEQQDVAIKEVKVRDVVLLSTIAQQAYCEHYADTWYDGGEWYLQNYLSVTQLQQELQDQNARFFLIYHHSAAVGFVKLNIHKPLEDVTSALELERIYLLKKWSGRRIGTFVLQYILELARKENKALVWLKVMDSNPGAVQFYQKMGFQICCTHAVDYVQKKEGMRGMYVMQRRL
jgi:ribosomal protein S18 acetylase RimI-like enzyme